MKFINENESAMKANLHKTIDPIAERWSNIGPKYLPELEAWKKSDSITAKEDYKMNTVLPSKLMHELKKDFVDLV